MNLTDIVNVVSKSAPILGTVIGGPMGGIASTAVALLANAFGANPKDADDILKKIAADPEAVFKMRQLEIDHEEFLIKSGNDALAYEYEDTKDARAMNVAYFEKTGHENFMLVFLTIMLFVSIAGAIYCIITYNTIIGETIAFMLGTLREELKNVYGMYFGGGKYNQKKGSEK